MTLPVSITHQLPPASPTEIKRIQRLEDAARQYPQLDLETHHVFHAGMYTRTILIPAGVLVTGALMRVPTMLTICGEVTVHSGADTIFLQGFHVIQGQSGRKNVFLAEADTYVSMSFPTDAKTVEEAENEFTTEAHLLLSRQHEGKE